MKQKGSALEFSLFVLLLAVLCGLVILVAILLEPSRTAMRVSVEHQVFTELSGSENGELKLSDYSDGEGIRPMHVWSDAKGKVMIVTRIPFQASGFDAALLFDANGVLRSAKALSELAPPDLLEGERICEALPRLIKGVSLGDGLYGARERARLVGAVQAAYAASKNGGSGQ